MGTKANQSKFDCYNKAEPDEAKGVVSSTCFTCAGMGYVECEDRHD